MVRTRLYFIGLRKCPGNDESTLDRYRMSSCSKAEFRIFTILLQTQHHTVHIIQFRFFFGIRAMVWLLSPAGYHLSFGHYCLSQQPWFWTCRCSQIFRLRGHACHWLFCCGAGIVNFIVLSLNWNFCGCTMMCWFGTVCSANPNSGREVWGFGIRSFWLGWDFGYFGGFWRILRLVALLLHFCCTSVALPLHFRCTSVALLLHF